MRPPDLLIRNAALRGRAGRWTLAATAGHLTLIARDDPALPDAATTIDADGALVTEPFVDAHLHLCKVRTLDAAGPAALAHYTGDGMGAAMAAIEGAAAVKRDQTTEDVLARARPVLRESVRHGVRAVQAFADVDPKADLTGVDALLTLREEFHGLVEIAVVAFPQDGLLREPGTEELLVEAIRRGADVVGGIPWIEWTDADAAEHVNRVTDLALEHGLRVAMLVDDAGDPGLRTTEMLAQALLDRRMAGRGSAQHARAMALYPEPYLRRLTGLCRAAGLGFVTDPHTGPLHLPALTLAAAGVPVALGQDDIEDAYYPFGRHNLLEVAFLAAHLLGARTDPDLERLYDMVTVDAARVIGRPAARLEPGAPADLVVLDGRTVREALTRHAPPRHVIVGGRVVASTTTTTEFSGIPAVKS
ncbi:cytosine deaminase [Thermocatellispora tengchongensis]|uniref:Cytosine deaminase n=1 Tax=Thermocatellispora tengchongensis TaxID=1073253 RepID=A0A840PMV5_9ACTN|nr:amidohydrolase family protein [Thermocatellispora tengchongensis]MBB5139353.1 cytosine deaminase [Thermocatellispora tengchongensis]